MRLLVSVRSAAEAKVATASGVDIVDAKEPDAGPLGTVTPHVLDEIVRALPDDVPLGVALGDVRSGADLALVLDRLALAPRSGSVFLKLGFAGVAEVDRVSDLLRLAARRARALGPSVSIVAAAYADHERARSPSPDEVLAAAISAEAAGVLVDTWGKDGRGLLRYFGAEELHAWVLRARSRGLLTAVAGSLRPETMTPVLAAEPDIVGVRGAACRGGRGGTLDPERVRRLRETLNRWVIPVA
jgi:(5-formylfuran-3-yl)methyl phosphate synthase